MSDKVCYYCINCGFETEKNDKFDFNLCDDCVFTSNIMFKEKYMESHKKLIPEAVKVLETGKKFDSNKPDLALLPYEALEEISKALMFGEQKYGRYNWKNNIEYSRIISAALRHIYKFNSKIDNDEETNLSHIAHAAANLMFLLYYIKNNIKENDNR